MRALSGLFATLMLAMAAPHATAASTTFAKVEIKLADAVASKAAGIRTLYITLYNADSKMPMPYGAMKVDLDKDAKGTVYKGTLDDKNIVVMGGGGGELKNLRIKARLDKDGSAGPDSPGDLVGIVEGVKTGAEASITIDKAL